MKTTILAYIALNMRHFTRGVRGAALLLIMLTLLSINALAISTSDFTFSHLGISEGLNSQRIFSLKQTEDNAIWMTTKSFVARYNGVSIENFYLTAKEKSHNKIGCNPRFVQTTEKVLQVFDMGGVIYEYNTVQKRFDIVADATSLFEKHDNQLNDVYKQGDTYWLAMSEGIYVLRNGNIIPIAKKIYASCIFQGKDGALLFGTRQGVKRVQSNKKSTSGYVLLPYLPYVTESGYYDTDTKQLWLGTYGQGLIIVDANGTCRQVSGVPHFPVRSFCIYNSKYMLVGVDGSGVYQMSRFASESNSASLLFNAKEGASGVLHGNGIYALLIDSWNNIVIGSYSGGIDIARPVGSTAAIYRHQRNNMQSLINDHVNCVIQLPSSELVMGTDDGISILNPQTGTWRHTARGMVVLALCPKPDGTLLASTYGDGVCQISRDGRVTPLYDKAQLGDDHIHDMIYDRNGHLWLGCQDADLIEISSEGKKHYPVGNVETLALMPDGRIAVGTINGLYFVTPGKGIITEFKHFSSNPDKASRHVLDVFMHDERYLFIATDGGGLYVYDLRDGRSKEIDTTHGLPSNSVMSISKDNLGRLWFATDKGMAFAYPDKLEKMVDVNYCYGLLREYTHGAATNLADGNLLFGSQNGAIVVNPNFVQELNYTTKLRFTGFSYRGGDPDFTNMQTAKMLENGKLRLAYDQRTFELYMESINMRNQFDIAYQYKLGDEDWSPLSTQQYILFTSLEPGTHHLIVRAVSRTSGIVLDEEKLDIIIGSPWWDSWWMWCVYILIIALLFHGAWWTYGLHNRYMRLVVTSLEKGTSGAHNDGANTSDNNTNGITDIKEALSAAISDEEAEETEDDPNSEFVDSATKIVVDHMSDSDFTIDDLCKEMAMSRTKFYIMLKSYTGKSPQDFVRIVRLERAAVLLRAGHPVSDVAWKVGFDNAKYFSTVFKKYFGVQPSKFK